MRKIKSFLLLLAVLLSPLTCCGGLYIIDILPSSLMPSTVDFVVNLFETEVHVENRTGEILYLTPITTTRGKPVVIPQYSSIRQRDFLLRPDRSLVLIYDAADMPLAGIAVCRTNTNCRLLATDYSDEYSLDSYENLPMLEQEWFTAIQSSQKWNLSIVIFPALGLVPIIFFMGWLYLIARDLKLKAR